MNNFPEAQCEYVLRSDGIHQLTLKAFGTIGADACMTQLERIYESTSDDSAPMRILINSPGATLPVNYMVQRGRELFAKYPHSGKTHIAIIADSSIEVRLADSFLRLIRFPRARVRFFDFAHLDSAVQWLLQDD